MFVVIHLRTVRLASQWMAAGFVHGVLNTDNMNVTGESFDYGPWRFAPTADPSFTAAYFDESGLYAFGRQGEAVAWNLAQLGGALSQITDPEKLNDALSRYAAHYERSMGDSYFARLGLQRTGEEDFQLVVDLLRWLTQTGAPYEQFFFDWFCGAASTKRALQSPIAELYEGRSFAPLKEKLLSIDPVPAERLEHKYFSAHSLGLCRSTLYLLLHLSSGSIKTTLTSTCTLPFLMNNCRS